MTYPIYLTNGTLLLDLNADAIDQSTSLTLIGRGVTGYGEAWNDNFVHVLENAASATAPTAPLVGQLWFNTSTHVLEVWKGPTGPWSGLAYASQIPSITTMRIALTGNTTYYVNSTTGNDSNIGTSTAPWLTLTHANSYISNNIDLVGYTVTINYNGSVYSTVTSNTPSITYSFGTTPTAPVALNVGERATITFSSASTIPLNIATATGGGIYRMNMVVTANNTFDSNWLLKPNNTTYAVNSFSSSGLEVGDGAVTAFGSATTLNTYTKLTTSPYVGNIAQSWTQVGGATTSIAFFFDLFAGPGTSDHVNGIGASISEFLVSTYTVAKMLKHSGGIMGGSSLSFSIWNDTTTAWTSLGTLVDMNGTSLSGTIIVERLA